MDPIQERRFFTPPKLRPLNLDLASLDGGGWAPAQYEGKTHDGRHVYCRYRGGGLSVWIANEPGANAYSEGACILEERIGPPYHGGLSLGQLCHYTGISINGFTPPLPDDLQSHEEVLKDLGGAVTHYNFIEYSTPLTARHLFNRLGIEAVSAKEKNSDWHVIVTGVDVGGIIVKEIEENDINEQKGNAAVFRLRYFGFDHIHKYSYRTEIFERDLGVNLKVAGQDEGCRYSNLSIDACFSKEDDLQLRLAIEFNKILNCFFPEVQFQCFDLKNGKRRLDKDYKAPIDLEVLKWILDGEDRWRSVFYVGRDKDNLEYLGYRPGSDT